MKQIRSLWLGFWSLMLGCLLVGCRNSVPSVEDPGPVWFEDVTEAVGLDFVHDAGPPDDNYFMPRITGSGAALFDFDGDGRLDIYLLSCGGPTGQPNRLFHQQSDGTFKDVSAGSGLAFAAYCQGVAIGDVNNDGFPDVLVTEYRGVRLFLNNGNGTFTDITMGSGLSNPVWGTSAAFVDYDRDGRLDLVIVNYLEYTATTVCRATDGKRDFCPPHNYAGTVSKLFRNCGEQPAGKGAGVGFKDVTISAGLAAHPGPGLGVSCADFDGDGWPDLFVANDSKPNHLWINQRDGAFKEEAGLRGIAVNAMGVAEANMGIGWGDVDGDGLQDLFVTHVNFETNTLWKQGPRGLFRDQTATTGLNRPARRATGFGTILADFDHNGAPDVAIVNGAVARTTALNPDPKAFWGHYAQHNQLFTNDGTGRFQDLSAANAGPRGFCSHDNVGRGLAIGDVANDGTLWLLTTEVAGPARLYRNVVPDRGHWLVIRVYDPALKREALGAEVTVRAGNRSWVRTVQAAGSYLCSNDMRVHVGLGKVDQINSIDVLWPDGSAEAFTTATVDCHIELRKGTGNLVSTQQ